MKSNVEWKQKDKLYYESPLVVEPYHKQFSKKYFIEHKYYSIYKWIEELIKLNKKTVLDFGCGTGIATIELLKAGIQTISVDASGEMLRKLSENAQKFNLFCKCIQADVEALPFEKEYFDAVICLGVLHHLPGVLNGLENQMKVLKKNGIIYIAEPFKNRPWISLPYHFLINIIKFVKDFFKIKKLTTSDQPLTAQTLKTIINKFAENGFECTINYLAYWPWACVFLPEKIAYKFIKLLNLLNFGSKRGDSVLIIARRVL